MRNFLEMLYRVLHFATYPLLPAATYMPARRRLTVALKVDTYCLSKFVSNRLAFGREMGVIRITIEDVFGTMKLPIRRLIDWAQT